MVLNKTNLYFVDIKIFRSFDKKIFYKILIFITSTSYNIVNVHSNSKCVFLTNNNFSTSLTFTYKYKCIIPCVNIRIRSGGHSQYQFYRGVTNRLFIESVLMVAKRTCGQKWGNPKALWQHHIFRIETKKTQQWLTEESLFAERGADHGTLLSVENTK